MKISTVEMNLIYRLLYDEDKISIEDKIIFCSELIKTMDNKNLNFFVEDVNINKFISKKQVSDKLTYLLNI